MSKWFATTATALIALLLTSTILVLVFGSVDKTPYLIKFFIGGGVPFLSARAVYRHFKAKELKEPSTPPAASSQQ